jgi:hypothetical protein
MDRKETLNAAYEAVNDRPNAYGPPEDNFARIAALWTAHSNNIGGPFGWAFDATDVAIMLALVKIARLEESPRHTDSWVDLAGYAACGAEVSTKDDFFERWAALTDEVGGYYDEEDDDNEVSTAEEPTGYYVYGDCDCECCRRLTLP